MGFIDIALMVAIVAAAGYLLYHSLWKKKGHCSGCEGCDCPSAEQKNRARLQIGRTHKNETKSCR